MDYRNVQWAAETLGLGEEDVIELLRSGELPGLQLGQTWLLSETSLREFLRAEEKRQREARKRRTVAGESRSPARALLRRSRPRGSRS